MTETQKNDKINPYLYIRIFLYETRRNFLSQIYRYHRRLD